jgi:nucleoside-diphosphate-sugar epimerase
LAALISGYESLTSPDDYFRINVQGLLRLIELCGRLKKPRFVFASSSTVYGNVARDAHSERALPSPTTIYALTKLVGEHTLAMYRDRFGYDDVSLRLFNVYGPRQNPDHPYANVTCKFARAAAHRLPVKLYGDGSQTRDFIYVDDVADVIFSSLEAATPSRVYNVGTGETRSIGALLELAQKLANTQLLVDRCPPWQNDIRSICADIGRLRNELHFEPQTKLEDGLRQTIDWFTGTQ